MITYERQEDGALKQVDSPPKRAELIEQRIYDRCIVRVGQLEAEKVTLEARIDELCAENERLRNQLHDQKDTAEHNFVRNAREYKRVCDENSKLRELASELWVSCPVHDSDCDECKHKGGRTGCELYDRMLELGVTA